MDATKLQEDYPIATPEYVMKLLKDYPVTTPEHVKELQKACPYVSLQDVVNCILNFGPHMATRMFDSSIHDINNSRENEELNGRVHVNAGPLLHVHSVHVKPKINKQLAVYGRIRVCFQNIKSGKRMKLDLYKRRANDAERISSCGGNLTLSWPLNYPWTKLQGTTIVVKLYHKIGRKGVLFAKEDIFVGDATRGNFEELISKEFHYEVCCATLTYIAMPFAALSRVDVRLSGKEKGRVVNVAGKIVARFKNTYGNYDSEGCVLFEKQDGFEPVVMNNELCMSRAWLGLPAYSSLELDLDLRDYDTCRKIKRRVELLTGNGAHASEYAEAADDFAIVVDARLFPYPLIVQPGWRDYDAFEAICRPKFGFGTSTSISLNHWFSYKGQPRAGVENCWHC
ncbi:unnamed protein product [Cuscuta campestris]|uniref:DUF6598 domain-containing protein n=1 Tax=Cuscuta campestris TaxID=132261 RepID=A0A484LFC4_9ASTE|nr:unnamed protein product [Cuscuta campestris]